MPCGARKPSDPATILKLAPVPRCQQKSSRRLPFEKAAALTNAELGGLDQKKCDLIAQHAKKSSLDSGPINSRWWFGKPVQGRNRT